MGWDEMFDDLAAQLEHSLAEEAERERAEEERLRIGRLEIRDRLLALAENLDPGDTIGIQLMDHQIVRFRPHEFGKDWCAGSIVGETGRTRDVLLPAAGIVALVLDRDHLQRSLRPRRPPRAGALTERLGLAYPLRDLGRRRRRVDLETPYGVLTGTIDRVARDHLDLAVHDRSDPRRESNVPSYRIVALGDIRLVHIAPA